MTRQVTITITTQPHDKTSRLQDKTRQDKNKTKKDKTSQDKANTRQHKTAQTHKAMRKGSAKSAIARWIGSHV